MNRSAIDLNADVGEGAAFDDQILSLVTSANVSCGAHAGNNTSIAAAVESARRFGVVVGAHPGFADRAGFGRSEPTGSIDDAVESLVQQLERLRDIGSDFGVAIQYVKPHGALYHLVSNDARAAGMFIDAVTRSVGPLPVLAPAGSALARVAIARGTQAFAEGFADRAYAPDGGLVARRLPGSVVADPEAAAQQAVLLATRGQVISTAGDVLDVPCDSICVHGDAPEAVAVAGRTRRALEAAGVRLRPFTPLERGR
jgi:UPF0271 protein